MSSHLPLLLHPLLNAIFNNPSPDDSPLREVYPQLLNGWSDGTVILIPPLDLLLNYTEHESEVPYSELCYSQDFVKDHVLVTQENKNAKLFRTLSDKEVLIKKDTLFTGKGFKKSIRLNVLSCEYFQNFTDYFPKGRRFMLMYIDGTLFGTPRRTTSFELISPSTSKTMHVVLSEDSQVKHAPRDDAKVNDTDASNGTGDLQATPRFEQLLRTFPLIAKSVGEQYQDLFRTFSVREAQDLDSLISLFHDAVEQASLIFETLSPELVRLIIDVSPHIDLNECVHNYVELNLHDKIWRRLCELYPDSIGDKYLLLTNISLNQVSLPEKFKSDLKLQSILEKKITKAIVEFQKLELTTDTSSKIEVFVNTIALLSKTDEITIDADTLVGLLLIVVVQTGVPQIANHLLYVQSLSYKEINTGMIGYSLSTFEGLIYYLNDHSNLKSLLNYSETNKRVFEYIDTKELLKLKQIADSFNDEFESSLRSRTVQGESLLMLAIHSNDYDTWKLLIDYEEIFPLEDILADQTVTDINLLNAALNYENFDIIDEIVDILLTSCTNDELIRYLNMKDTHHRTIGHYLFHYQSLIPKLGPFIDWTMKDLNGQTPLFAICRSYDVTNYNELIETVFKTITKWYDDNGSEFDYEDHVDLRGNTLLHILNSKIDVLLQNRRVNVNESNKKRLTPLMVYAKYNRIDNVREILKQPSVEVCKTDKHFFTCLDHSKNSVVSQLIDTHYLNDTIQPVDAKQLGLIRVKLENNIWKIVIRAHYNGTEYFITHPFKDFKHLVEILKMEFPNTFLPLDYSLKNFEMILNFSSFNKLKLNKVIDDLNIFLQALLFNKPMAKSDVLWEFLTQKEFDYLESSQRITTQRQKLLNETWNDIVLQPEEISEINFFLKFSAKELMKLRGLYDKLYKVVCFKSRKRIEIKYAMELFADASCGSNRELEYLCKILQDSVKELNFDEELCDKVLYLSLSCETMITRINELMNTKIFRWWKLYGELIELNNTYKKFKFVELRKTHGIEQANEVAGLVDVNEESFQDLTSSTSFDSTLTKTTKKPKPGFLTNFIESKRSKFEGKLLTSLKSVKHELSALNKDIKFNHEAIAMEMNNFVNFKTDFLKLIIKKYVKRRIQDTKFSTLMLERGLSDVRL